MPKILRLYSIPFFSFVTPVVRVLQRLRRKRIKLWRIEGTEKTSGKPFSIIISATRENRIYLLDLLFASGYSEHPLGSAWLWNLGKKIQLRARSCSMVMVEVDEGDFKFLKEQGWKYIPSWILGEIELPYTSAVLNSMSLKSDLRRIRNKSLQYEASRNPRRLDDFYFNMYLPYITKTHGRHAQILPLEAMRAAFGDCVLILVRDAEREIAGIIINLGEECPRLWYLGIRDANPAYVKAGAIGALYHFALKYLQELGYQKARLGWSRGFLRDGVLVYKKKWAPEIVGTFPTGFALGILSVSEAAIAVLVNNPFVYKESGKLYGAVYVDFERPLAQEEIQAIHTESFYPGLSKLVITYLRPRNTLGEEEIPAEYHRDIQVRSAHDITATME